MTPATLRLAPHVGSFIAATTVANDALLAIALSAGARGEHRVCVLDTATWTSLVTFAIPSRAKSGITPILGEGDVIVTNDDHTLAAFNARTGRAETREPDSAP